MPVLTLVTSKTLSFFITASTNKCYSLFKRLFVFKNFTVSADEMEVDPEMKAKQKGPKKILANDSLHNGEILINRTPVFNGESLEGSLMLVLEEETFTDAYVSQMQNGVIFSLLCDMAACFQALGHFSEAGKCLEEAGGRIRNNYHLKILESLNIFADKGKHSSEKLIKAFEIADFALSIVRGEIYELENEPDSKFMAGYTDAASTVSYINDLQADVKLAMESVTSKNKELLDGVLAESGRQFKSLRQFNKKAALLNLTLSDKSRTKTVLKSNLKIPKKQKAISERALIMSKLYPN